MSERAGGVFTACLMHGGKEGEHWRDVIRTAEKKDEMLRQIWALGLLYGVQNRAVEPMARVYKMALGKSSLARNVHYCPSFCYSFCPTSVSMLCRTTSHISDTVQTAYQLPLLPNNTAVRHLYTNRSGAKC